MKRFAALTLIAAGCAAANGLDGQNALINVSQEPASSACEYGGVKIQSGLDNNNNGALDVTEVDDTEYVCNGADKAEATRTRASDEPPGANCEFGGVRIDLGFDTDENGALGDGEVEDTDYVCNGEDGIDGTDGTNGTDGQDGTNGVNGADGSDGVDGQDGLSYLTDLVPVVQGGACGAVAGVRIQAGPDNNGNGTLDTSEVSESSLVCNGADGQDGTGAGGTDVVFSTGYDDMVTVSADGVDVTLIAVTITAPSAGSVLAFGSTDAYCSTTSSPQCGSILTRGHLRITNTNTGAVTSGLGRSYFHLEDEATENISIANNFTVTGAGSRTYYMRAEAEGGAVGFWRTQLNVVFVAD